MQISRFPVNSGLFSLCLFFFIDASLTHSIFWFWVFSSHFDRLESHSYVTNITLRNGNNSKNDAFMQKFYGLFTGVQMSVSVSVSVCACASMYATLNWPFELKWKETDIIIAKFFRSFHMWLANIFSEFWSFTIRSFFRFSLNYIGNFCLPLSSFGFFQNFEFVHLNKSK